MFPVDHFFRAARRWPDRIAVQDGERLITYGELARRASAIATGFQAIDPTPQSRVGVCAYNTVEHLEAWLGAFAAGKTWVPLNPRNGKEELSRVVAVTEPSIVVVDGDCLDKVDTGAATRVLGKPGAGVGNMPTLAGLAATHDGEMPRRFDFALDDLQAIKFTGGSSGVPKGVMQTYRVWNTCISSMLAELRFDQDDRHLLAVAMTHGTNTLIMPTFAAGGRQVFMGQGKPDTILDAFETYGVTTVFLPPTVIYMMMAEPGVEQRRFPSLRHLIVGGAAIRASELPKAMRIFNNAVETCFGQTEAPQIATIMRAEEWQDPANHASMGRATCLTRLEIMDPEGNILPPGQSGEIVLKGDLVMKGYYKMPDKTAETIIDGWLHTGDVGLIDERGYVFLKDRIRDVIITGGFNVYPSDVEAVMGRHPAVKECVVFGVPDLKWGEVVQAAVELHAGSTATGEDIAAFVKDHLDSVKTPKVVHVVKELPRSGVGKVLRREAKVMFTPKEGAA